MVAFRVSWISRLCIYCFVKFSPLYIVEEPELQSGYGFLVVLKIDLENHELCARSRECFYRDESVMIR